MTRTALNLADDLKAAAAQDPAYPAGRFAGRGIVICAGGARFFTCAWVAIGILRRQLGCTLPIEVWYLGEAEMSPAMQTLLREQGVELVDALEVARRHPAGRFDGWELKSYAITHSRFQEVLLLDADNVPVADPAFLFDSAEYAATGALFWPDIVRLARNNEIWAVSGLEPWAGQSFESGQLVIDKARSWRALQLALWINQRAAEFYRFLYGDKDSFLIAWLMTGTPFSQIAHAPRLIDSTLCQRAPDGAVLFQHRHAAKWLLFARNPVIEGFRFEPECRALLDALALRWDGHVFTPPPRSAACRALEAELVQQGRFRLILLGDSEIELNLIADHRACVGERLRCYWHVEDGPVLALHRGGLRIGSLTPDRDGVWRGEHLRTPQVPAILQPVAPRPPVAEPDEGERVLAAVLAHYRTLPQDSETLRDLLGTLRSLGRLWPDALARLVDPALLAEAGGAAATRSAALLRRDFASYAYDRDA
jgi:hypothetical protein